jgi:hypothetical protein
VSTSCVSRSFSFSFTVAVVQIFSPLARPSCPLHGSRFPLPSLSCSLPPPSLLPCVPVPPPITLISLLPLPSKRPLRPLSSLPRVCSLLLDPIAPSPTPMPASPSRPRSSWLRCPLRRRRPPPTPDIFCNLPSPNRTRIDFGGGNLVGGVDQRVVAMVGARVKETKTCFAFAHNFGSPVHMYVLPPPLYMPSARSNHHPGDIAFAPSPSSITHRSFLSFSYFQTNYIHQHRPPSDSIPNTLP